MKNVFVKFLFVLAFVVSLSTMASAQFPEDALRLSSSGLSLGARSLGMGGAFTAIADDYSAVYGNPAGLGQIRVNEMSLGLSHNAFGNTSSFYGTSQSLNNSATNINSFGLVYAVPTDRGSMVIALGYGKQADFTSALSFNGFNPVSSIIPRLFDADTSLDLAYNLNLQRGDGSTPFNDSLTQIGKILEGGGINHWSVSGSAEAVRNLFVGATVSFISGSYSYNRTYREIDTHNKYTTQRFGSLDLTEFQYVNTISDDISGFNARLGLLYKINDRAKFGLALKTPSFITVRETFSNEGTSIFDTQINGTDTYYYRLPDGRIEYDVRTPFVFSGGFAYGFSDLTVSGDLEYTDWSQMEFTNTDSYLLTLNSDIKEIYRPTANVRIGAEYTFSDAGVHLRGGFAYLPSPYNDDPSSFAQKYVTGGIGFSIENSFNIDLGYSRGFWDTKHINYGDYNFAGRPTSETTEQVKTNNLITTISFRF